MKSEAGLRRAGGVHFEPALLSLVDRAARRMGLPDLPLDAGELTRAAERRAGRSFRTREIEIALAAAIDACEREADLSLFGRFSFRWDAPPRPPGPAHRTRWSGGRGPVGE